MFTFEMSFSVLILLITLALLFDFINGFHDAANSIATIVSTGVLKPQQAVLLATFFNFLAIFVFKLKVAATIGKGILDPSVIDHRVIFSALSSAIIWSIITWWRGIPSSSSHALIGSLIGAALIKEGLNALIGFGIIKIVIFIFVSPLLGFLLATLFTIILSKICFRASPTYVDRWFRRLQLLSASLYSLGHGGNDAQKTIGLIWLLLISSGYISADDNKPLTWIVVSCYVAMSLGTLFGGWRIVKTMGQKITKLRPFGGFCAETAGAFVLFLSSSFGIPVSTTHTITGAIIGVGSAKRISAVRWGLASNIVYAWILTMPISAIIAAIIYLLFFNF